MRTLINLLFRRPPDFLIGDEDAPYLRRWWIIPKNDDRNYYLHHFCRDDVDRALHDHPWESLSIVIWGGYHEVTQLGKRWFGIGSVIRRQATYRHRIIVSESGRDCWTIFITGPKVREWGFWCPKGFVHWRDFVDPTNTGRVGVGCGD